jgi:hypothetical protein
MHICRVRYNNLTEKLTHGKHAFDMQSHRKDIQGHSLLILLSDRPVFGRLNMRSVCKYEVGL